MYSSLVFNYNDEPYIAYYDSDNENLKIAHHDGASWTITTVDSNGNVGRSLIWLLILLIRFISYTTATLSVI